ncbi:hypothetical protein LTR62_001992 [Meristemomyces frigidus]|uniref:Uncharacterized protein n=1 Tax=Meristemomyces frigidus TaxID=1508187 RepID=A0AAN7TMT5_9PEZI|nr:hypothetical protein LTR62_001992 [Meristemomyces frigidus]
MADQLDPTPSLPDKQPAPLDHVNHHERRNTIATTANILPTQPENQTPPPSITALGTPYNSWLPATPPGATDAERKEVVEEIFREFMAWAQRERVVAVLYEALGQVLQEAYAR